MSQCPTEISGGCILVVDDSPTARYATAAVIAAHGYDVTTADDGDHALALLDHQHFDVVVLDVVLPKKNGYQVCRQLKSHEVNSPKVLMLTSKSQASDEVWGRRQGADDYLTKLVDENELLTSLRSMMVSSLTSKQHPQLATAHPPQPIRRRDHCVVGSPPHETRTPR